MLDFGLSRNININELTLEQSYRNILRVNHSDLNDDKDK